MIWIRNCHVADVAVINASPLIFFSRSGHMAILHHFADRILAPKPVVDEIQARGKEDTTARSISRTEWLEVAEIPPIAGIIQSWGLGVGESSVIALAREHSCEAIIDDRAGRRCASSLGVPLRGTLGIVLAAKNRGVISQARSVMEDMIRQGLYLSRHVLDRALKNVGE